MTENIITIPKISEDLAYLSGFIIGDGHLHSRENKEYRVTCSGGLDEEEFYKSVIIPLFENLFNIIPKIRISHRDSTFNINIYSKRLLRFLSETIGIPVGKKCHKISIPEIFKASKKLNIAFLQGYADADFSLTLKKRYKNVQYYPVIVGASASKTIIKEVCEILKNMDFSISVQYDVVKHDIRCKDSIAHYVSVYGHKQLVKWMQNIGFRNTKILKKYELWKERNQKNAWARSAFEIM